MILVLTFTFLIPLLSAQDVQLSIESSSNVAYVGYLWANNKFVFLKPELRATVNGKSVSKKICGFELRSYELKSIPYMVYLVDEISGLGEIKVKPHTDLDYQKETNISLTVVAYDCDVMPHYSKRVNILIHASNFLGPKFDKKEYSFSIKKNSTVGEIVGTIKAKSAENQKVTYSLYHAGELPFGINKFGTINTLSSLESIDHSLIYFRVVATEQSNKIPRQTIASITVQIISTCNNKLYGVPDQLDYKIKNRGNNIIVSERIIQDQSQPHLEFCYLPSPFKEIKFLIFINKSNQYQLPMDNIKICQTDIATNRMQRRICEVNPGTIDVLIDKGIIELNDENEAIKLESTLDLNKEFTFTWWMKRQSKLQTKIFCFQNNGSKEIISIYIVDCKVVVWIAKEKQVFNIPGDICQINIWLYYTISQEIVLNLNLKMTVAGRTLFSILRKTNIFHLNTSRIYIGQCSSSTNNFHKQLLKKHKLQIGVISLSKDKHLSMEEISCMSTCGEALLVSKNIKKSPDIALKRQENYLHLTSTNIQAMIQMLSKIEYANSYCSTSRRHCSENAGTEVAIDVFIVCKSGETITIPRSLIKINVVLPQRDPINDTIEVDIYMSSTVLTKNTKSIMLFPDIRFVNSLTEEPIKQGVKIEECSIRPLQQNFIKQEKIYLTHIMMPLVKEFNLKIKNNEESWILEGEGTGELYESLLKHVSFNMNSQRRKLLIVCRLKGGELTSQASVDVILITKEENSMDFDHKSKNERMRMTEYGDRYLKDHFEITKSKFVGVVIIAIIGGATWAVITIIITYFIIQRRGNLMTRNRKKLNNNKSYQRHSNPICDLKPQLVYNLHNDCNHYCDEDDRISMADVPDADERCLDNISCDACNMTDHDITSHDVHSSKDIPRSKTINFPIIHKRF